MKVAFNARRVRQSINTFHNWPGLIANQALTKAGRGPAELTFRARSGASIMTPNSSASRAPVYEVLAEDCYRISWLLDGFIDR